MKSKYETPFTAAANKIVRHKEWKKKTKALYKAELSLKEKIYLNLIDRPLSVVASLIAPFKDLENYENTIIIGKDYKFYLAGAGMPKFMQDGESLLPNKNFQRKISSIAARAFAQCADASNSPALKNNDKAVEDFISRNSPGTKTTVKITIKQR